VNSTRESESADTCAREYEARSVLRVGPEVHVHVCRRLADDDDAMWKCERAEGRRKENVRRYLVRWRYYIGRQFHGEKAVTSCIAHARIHCHPDFTSSLFHASSCAHTHTFVVDYMCLDVNSELSTTLVVAGEMASMRTGKNSIRTSIRGDANCAKWDGSVGDALITSQRTQLRRVQRGRASD
jgi:hypothetical protein